MFIWIDYFVFLVTWLFYFLFYFIFYFQVKRVLKPGGKFVCLTLAESHVLSKFPYFCSTMNNDQKACYYYIIIITCYQEAIVTLRVNRIALRQGALLLCIAMK